MSRDYAPGPFSSGPIVTGRPSDAGSLESERDTRFDNQPPLLERILMEFEEDLAKEGLAERAATLLAAVNRAPACDCTEAVGKIGDFLKQCAALEKALEAVREKHNRPLIDARTALKNKTDGMFTPLAQAMAKLRRDVSQFMAAEAARCDAERREAEEVARKLRETVAPGVPVEIQPRKVEAPVARGDLGAKVSTRTVWKHEVTVPVKQLPKAILDAPAVKEAIDKVIGQMIRAGSHEIKGVKIWSEQEAVVR